MNEPTSEIARRALDLDEEERVELVAVLLDSLEPEMDEAESVRWDEELRRRSAEMTSGVVRGVPWSEVRARLAQRSGER
jgi:putative addiction module component (TIGR02574 family)